MENKIDRAKIAQMIFAKNKAIDTLYFTSDNQAFTLKSDALNHAKTLEDKAVSKVEKEGKETPETEAEGGEEKDNGKKEKAGKEK